jgi:hypothetical protein
MLMGLEFPISEEKERYGDLAYREERIHLGYGARTRFLIPGPSILEFHPQNQELMAST